MHTVPTLQQYLLNELKDHPNMIDIAMIMADMATIGKLISSQTNRAGLTTLLGKTSSQNVHEEQQAQLDVYANELCKSYLSETGHFAALASEEEDDAVALSQDGKYIIAFDPLDGSSNIDVNVSIGTIFSVMKRRDDVPHDSKEQFFQQGDNQVLAGYILYGSSTVLVFSWGEGVVECTLDQDIGEFFVSNQNMKFPEASQYYSTNEAYTPDLKDSDLNFLTQLKSQSLKQRWIGSLVADFHRNMITGGIHLSFTRAGKDKLRLLYELNPLAFIAEQAGGSAVEYNQRILEISPNELHQRAQFVCGNNQLVNQYKETV